MRPIYDSLPTKARRGFALIVALAMMAFIIILLVSLTSLTRVETAVASATEDSQLAREYARTAMFEALGKLQRYAGKDQVSTARGDILSAGNTEGSKFYLPTDPSKKYWTAVFDAKVFQTDRRTGMPVDKPSESLGSVVQWLVSGDPTETPRTRASTPVNLAEKDANNLNKWAMLVSGRGDDVTTKTQKEDPLNAVYAPLEDIKRPLNNTNTTITSATETQLIGRKAWWVGDSGIKAKVNVIDPYKDFQSAELNRIYRAATTQRVGIEAIPGFEKYGDITTAELEKVLTEKSLELLEVSAEADPRVPLIKHWHDITAYGQGLQTNTRFGGLKHDLSLVFGRPKVSGRPEDKLHADFDGKRMFWPAIDPTDTTGNKGSGVIRHFDPLNGRPYDPDAQGNPTYFGSLKRNFGGGKNPGGPFWNQIDSYVKTRAESGSIAVRNQTDKVMGIAPVLHTFQVKYAISASQMPGIVPPGSPPDTLAPTVWRYNAHVMPAIVLWNPYNVDIEASDYTVVMWVKEVPGASSDSAAGDHATRFIHDAVELPYRKIKGGTPPYVIASNESLGNTTLNAAIARTPSGQAASRWNRFTTNVPYTIWANGGAPNSWLGITTTSATACGEYCELQMPLYANYRTTFYVKPTVIKAGQAIVFSCDKHTPFNSHFDAGKADSQPPTLEPGFHGNGNFGLFTNKFQARPGDLNVDYTAWECGYLGRAELVYWNSEDPTSESGNTRYTAFTSQLNRDINPAAYNINSSRDIALEIYAGKINATEAMTDKDLTKKYQPLVMYSGMDFTNQTYQSLQQQYMVWNDPKRWLQGDRSVRRRIIDGIASFSTSTSGTPLIDVGTPQSGELKVKDSQVYGRKAVIKFPETWLGKLQREGKPNGISIPLGMGGPIPPGVSVAGVSSSLGQSYSFVSPKAGQDRVKWLAINNPRSPVMTKRSSEFQFGHTNLESGYGNISNYLSSCFIDGQDDAFKIFTVDGTRVPVGYSDYKEYSEECVLFDIPRSEDFVFTSLGQLMHANTCIYSYASTGTNNATKDWNQIYVDGYGIENFMGENNQNAYTIGAGTPGIEIALDKTFKRHDVYSNISGFATASKSFNSVTMAFNNSTKPSILYVPNCYTYDLAYRLNESLWDHYFFSSIPRPSDISKRFYTSQVDPSTNKLQRLPSGRLRPYRSPDPDITHEVLFSDYKKIGAGILMDGAFNVNSTSVDAWAAILASNYGVKVPTADGNAMDAGTNQSAFPGMTQVPKDAANINSADTDSQDPGAYKGFRSLNSTEIRELATKIVEQVKFRGPFANLSDFVNRTPKRYDDSVPPIPAEGLNPQVVGVLQAAIDSTSINKGFKDEAIPFSETAERSWIDYEAKHPNKSLKEIYPIIYPGYQAAEGNVNEGVPGYLTQQDLLYHLGPVLSTRSDCFVIRAYGEVRDPSDLSKVLSKAWCEATVQRIPDFVDSTTATGDKPWAQLHELKSTANKTFGRRFVLVDFRWLKEDEL